LCWIQQAHATMFTKVSLLSFLAYHLTAYNFDAGLSKTYPMSTKETNYQDLIEKVHFWNVCLLLSIVVTNM